MGTKNEPRDTSEATKKKKIVTRATRLKNENQKATRDRLQSQGHIQHVLKIADKLEEEHKELEPSEIQALKAAADIKLKIIAKYQPDLKSVEISQDPDNPIQGLTTAELEARIAVLLDAREDS